MRDKPKRSGGDKERRKSRRKVGVQVEIEQSIISTATVVKGQEMMLIMKHVNLTVQGKRERYRDKDEVNKEKNKGAPQQYEVKDASAEKRT